MAKPYTPGPWIIDDQFISSKIAQQRDDWDNATICQWGSYTHRANARLIAQAPAMADYIKEHAAAGDEKALALLKKIEGRK